jgi:hypothetical protein
MEWIDYWKLKGQAATVESAVETYPSGVAEPPVDL